MDSEVLHWEKSWENVVLFPKYSYFFLTQNGRIINPFSEKDGKFLGICPKFYHVFFPV